MKKIFVTMIAFCIGLSVWAQQPVMLKLNPVQNKTYRIKTVSTQNMSQTMGGMQQNTAVNSTTVLSMKMVESGVDFLVMEIRFDTMLVNTNAAGMNIDINSSKPGDLQSNDIGEVLSVLMNRYCSNPLYAKMGFDGKVIELINLKLFTDLMMKDVDSIKSQYAQVIKSRAAMMADPGSIQSTIESITAYLPGKEVETGGSWDISLKTNSGGMMYLITSKYKLNGTNNNIADIGFDSTIEPASSAPVKMDAATITNNIRGSSKSAMTIETNTGMIIKSEGKYHMEGDLGVEAQGMNMSIPTVISGETTIVALP
ncbi:MAG: hypothetical protein JXB00_01445 [Bacteroidales bacterium]|nr:hypothetical protein [Bacteroidales bacterium]